MKSWQYKTLMAENRWFRTRCWHFFFFFYTPCSFQPTQISNRFVKVDPKSGLIYKIGLIPEILRVFLKPKIVRSSSCACHAQCPLLAQQSPNLVLSDPSFCPQKRGAEGQ